MRVDVLGSEKMFRKLLVWFSPEDSVARPCMSLGALLLVDRPQDSTTCNRGNSTGIGQHTSSWSVEMANRRTCLPVSEARCDIFFRHKTL